MSAHKGQQKISERELDEIMENIRKEVSSRGLAQPAPARSPDGVPQGSGDFPELHRIISAAEAHADAGAEVSPMTQFGGLTRQAAMIAGKVVVYLASFITDKQRSYNREVVRALRSVVDAIAGLQKQSSQNREQQSQHFEQRLQELRAAHEAELASHRTELNTVAQELRDHKIALLEQQRSVQLLLDEVQGRLPAPLDQAQLGRMAKERDHLLDALYIAFEDRFRGTREDIKNRQRVYLPYIGKAVPAAATGTILDIGCGRGEWLELLKENGYSASGIDLNRAMVSECRERGLDAEEAEVIDYLRRLPDNSLAAITGFHIIEHLSLQTLLALFDESLRTLQPGGMMIFETPNPENLVVGACNFYYDPTHRNPLPPAPIKFFAEWRGFGSTEILRLHKVKEPELTGQPHVDELLLRVNMEQDYAIIGYKA
jgi:SAM-dependent methyltransferase